MRFDLSATLYAKVLEWTFDRDELIARTRAKVALRAAPRPTVDDLTNGVSS